MQPERPDLKYICDMLEYARTVIDLTNGVTLAAYEADMHRRLAVERAIEIIGEAARRVTPEFQEQHAEVAWSAIIATRHILAHEYGDIQHDKVWRIATFHVPMLVTLLQPILDANPPEPGAA